MAEAAAASESTGVNPNIEVGAESTVTAGGGSQVTFEDIERITEQEADEKARGKPKLVKEQKAPKDEVEGVDPSASKDKKAAKAAAESEGEEDETPEKAAKPAAPKGVKTHKLKIGDQLQDIAGDATFTIPVNGKKVEVPLQDLVNDYNGKTEWHRRMSEADQIKTDFTAKEQKINSLVGNLVERAVTQKDPDAAFDFLAEMTKQDPVEMKSNILRQQFEALLPVFEMTEQERTTWFEDQKRGWRDKLHTNRTKAIQAEESAKQEQAKRQEVMQQFGIDDERYGHVEKLVHDHLKAHDPKFDGKVTQEQIIYADRRIMAYDVIEDTIPDLVNRPDFGNIEKDIMRELLSHPELTREQLAKQLTAVFGSGDKGLRKLGSKVARSATASQSEAPQDARPRQSKEVTFFDDL